MVEEGGARSRRCIISGVLSHVQISGRARFPALAGGGRELLHCGSARSRKRPPAARNPHRAKAADRLPEIRRVAEHVGTGVNRNYWSATTVSNNTANAWNTNLSNGNTNNNAKTNANYVRCVRPGMVSSASGSPRFLHGLGFRVYDDEPLVRRLYVFLERAEMRLP
ncbi:MAG: hypothetical protein UY67_C0030G0010 [Candidatus Kaiserbacteria bacterium GW2011_GWA2_52_12]|uniref:Uncharacterized protein n=1 Tax=Candidatus Kaiserbacteria bacterium GW2011_GWA2_52_12 TaxID=1618671 RepID=A0A0G1WVV8_9BACT|nr:MAG: hypothetical protein UY67_C0030G0010 [Candidatus Kaiserbacteria bacterium GW2011_GWA2_52_12]